MKTGIISVTQHIAHKGLKVVRGRDWIYSNQDGGAGNEGTIVKVEGVVTSYWASVKWDNGHKDVYRIGPVNLDLYVSTAESRALYEKKPTTDPTTIPTTCWGGVIHNKPSEKETESKEKLVIGSIVKVKDASEYWTKKNGHFEGVRYIVKEIVNNASVKFSHSLYFMPMWNFEVVDIASKEAHRTAEKEDKKSDKTVKMVREMLGEWNKELKNSQTTQNVKRTQQPIKVRRTVSVVQGAKRRSSYCPPSRRSRSRSCLSND